MGTKSLLEIQQKEAIRVENLAIIAASKLFYGVAQEEVAALLASANARWRSCAQGEVILLAGSRARDIGVVCAGEVYVAREEITGERSLLARLGVGELFAEAYACAGTTRLPVSTIAAQDCQVLLVDAQSLLAAREPVAACARVRENLIRILAQKSVLLNRRLTHLSRRSTREKVLSYFAEQAARQGNPFTVPARQEMADFLCVERSAMCAVIGKMRAAGEIAVEGRKITLLPQKGASKA